VLGGGMVFLGVGWLVSGVRGWSWWWGSPGGVVVGVTGGVAGEWEGLAT